VKGMESLVSTLALVIMTEDDPDVSASDEVVSYDGQIIEEFSGEEDGGLTVVLGADPNISASDPKVEVDQDMSAQNISGDDLLELPGPQFEKCLRDVFGPDISLANMADLPMGEFHKYTQSMEKKGRLREIHSALWKVRSVGQQSSATQAVEGLMELTSGEQKGPMGQGRNKIRVSKGSGKTRVSKGSGVGTTGEKGGKKKRNNRVHFDTRIVKAAKYLLGEQTGHHVVVEIGNVVHHPECGNLRRGNGTSLRGLTPRGAEKGRVRILGGKGGGQPLTVMAVSPEKLRALLEKAKGGGHNLYPRCK